MTTDARMCLYSYLDRPQERAINFDADSVFYIQKGKEPRLTECGDNLGDMTDGLRPGEYIEDFVSGGRRIMLGSVGAGNRKPSVKPAG